MEVEIFVNARCLSRRTTGVERYAREVIRRLDGEAQLLAPEPGLQGFWGHWWEQISLPKAVPEAALLWSPANSGPIRVPRQVVTLHDLSVLDHPEWFTPAFSGWYGLLLPQLARRARRIITDSVFSRERILDRLGVSEELVAVIPCGVDREQFRPRSAEETAAVRAKYGLQAPYLLFVGTQAPRKNLDSLLKAWARLQVPPERAELILTGAQSGPFRRPGSEPLPAGVRSIGYVAEDNLAQLYSGAHALVIPSRYEGFGLPALEAMASGTPVVASHNTSFPEVLGDAAVMVDPASIDSIAEGISRILEDDAHRARLRARGLDRARQYSWESTAEQIRRVLREAAAD